MTAALNFADFVPFVGNLDGYKCDDLFDLNYAPLSPSKLIIRDVVVGDLDDVHP